jgi:LEA14-like dessication related protein
MKKSLFKKSVLTLFILLIVLLFTTCQTISASLQEPVISLHSVELAEITFSGTHLVCKVQIENPNPFDIPFPEVGWEFFINTNSFVKGVTKNDRRIRAKNATIIEVPVALNYIDIFRVFSSLKGRSDFDYKAALAVKFNIPVIGDKVWRFEPSGTVPLPQPPKLSSPVMRVESSDLSRLEWYVSVNVENPNPFELPAPKINFNYQVAGTSILRNAFTNRQKLAPSSVTPVVFGIVVYYADVFRVLPNLRNTASAPSNLDMTFDFSIPAFSGDTFNLQIPALLALAAR